MNFFSTQPTDNIICPDESLSKTKEDDNYVHKLSDIYKTSPCQPKIFKSLLSQLNTSGSLCDKSQKQYIYQQLQQQVSNCNPKCKINKNLELNSRDWETLNSEYDKCQTERGLKKDKQNKKFEKVYPSEWMQKEQMDGQQEQMDGQQEQMDEQQIAEINLERENEDIRNDFNRVRDNGTDEEQRVYGNNLVKAQQYISDQSPEAKWNMNPDKKGGKRKSLGKKSKKRKSKKNRKSKSKKSRKSKTRKSKSRKGRSRRR
jgi:hypothetical protein